MNESPMRDKHRKACHGLGILHMIDSSRLFPEEQEQARRDAAAHPEEEHVEECKDRTGHNCMQAWDQKLH